MHLGFSLASPTIGAWWRRQCSMSCRPSSGHPFQFRIVSLLSIVTAMVSQVSTPSRARAHRRRTECPPRPTSRHTSSSGGAGRRHQEWRAVVSAFASDETSSKHSRESGMRWFHSLEDASLTVWHRTEMSHALVRASLSPRVEQLRRAGHPFILRDAVLATDMLPSGGHVWQSTSSRRQHRGGRQGNGRRDHGRHFLYYHCCRSLHRPLASRPRSLSASPNHSVGAVCVRARRRWAMRYKNSLAKES